MGSNSLHKYIWQEALSSYYVQTSAFRKGKNRNQILNLELDSLISTEAWFKGAEEKEHELSEPATAKESL